jgi:hypothetical protein
VFIEWRTTLASRAPSSSVLKLNQDFLLVFERFQIGVRSVFRLPVGHELRDGRHGRLGTVGKENPSSAGKMSFPNRAVTEEATEFIAEGKRHHCDHERPSKLAAIIENPLRPNRD